ncbi:alkyl sulfatase C-terminal domain-containing protein [Kitasatospora griseola]|uniref:alkyl sulfatase C-terminal domain-containing protein n=1 Tax=Kitasatospora griseola TaxID=2064 RepID=UPI002285E565|nr:alkyl sulfatase C-terminal domain-containing protein [Kitasatospora griseola]
MSGLKAWDHSLTALRRFTDLDRTYRTSLCNGGLVHPPAADGPVDLALVLTEPQLMGPLTGHGLDRIDHTGDPTVPTTLMSVLGEPDPGFAVVTLLNLTARDRPRACSAGGPGVILAAWGSSSS